MFSFVDLFCIGCFQDIVFNNISVISWQSALLVNESEVIHKPLANLISWYCIEYTFPWTWHELTT